jgi:hypothetical protein
MLVPLKLSLLANKVMICKICKLKKTKNYVHVVMIMTMFHVNFYSDPEGDDDKGKERELKEDEDRYG